VLQDQWRSPTWAEDLARGCLAVSEKKATGIYHISGPEVLSVYDFVLRIAAVFGLDPSLVTPISTAQLGQAAQRPARTGFLLDNARSELNYTPHYLE
jgi:dTDP-4-dehydrorhamnose reductase